MRIGIPGTVGYVVNNYGEVLVPLRIKLSNPFQMAELHLCMACTVNGGGILTTYKSWDDPPSKPLINGECWMLHRR